MTTLLHFLSRALLVLAVLSIPVAVLSPWPWWAVFALVGAGCLAGSRVAWIGVKAREDEL